MRTTTQPKNNLDTLRRELTLQRCAIIQIQNDTARTLESINNLQSQITLIIDHITEPPRHTPQPYNNAAVKILDNSNLQHGIHTEALFFNYRKGGINNRDRRHHRSTQLPIHPRHNPTRPSRLHGTPSTKLITRPTIRKSSSLNLFHSLSNDQTRKTASLID